MDLNLSFDLRVEPLSKYHLDDISMHRLRGGEIVALDDQYTFCNVSHAATTCWQLVLFISLLPPSDAIAGYRPDRFYCHFLAFPVFIWMRPHWQDMLKLEAAAQRFGDGHLSERIHFDEGSSFERLGVAFNQMADNINALIASKNSLLTVSLTNCEHR